MIVMIVMIVMIMGIVFEEIRVNIQLGVQIEAAQIKHFSQRHFAKVHRFLRRSRVHVLQAVLQSIQILR